MIKAFEDFKEFKKEAEELGYPRNLEELISLDFNFFEKYEEFTVINLRDYGYENKNNLLVLTDQQSLLYSEKTIEEKDLRLYKFTLKKKYGESTVLALLTAQQVLENYEDYFEKINKDIDELEESLNIDRIQENAKKLRKLHDQVEDFEDLLLEVKGRKVREIRTDYVTYDFDLLVGKTTHLLDRIKSHLSQLNNLRNEYDILSTRELNHKITFLTEVMKKLTAITVILTVPMLIGSWYGMNFKYMPELGLEWTYPALIAITIAITVFIAIAFRLRDWL